MISNELPSEATEKTAAKIAGVIEKLALTKKELCEATGLSVTTLWRLEKRGLLLPVPGIRHKIYAKAAIDRFLSGKAAA